MMADLKAHYIFEEHMHALEVEEAEKDRIIEEALLALSDDESCPTCFGHGGCADCMNEDASDDYEVPAC